MALAEEVEEGALADAGGARDDDGAAVGGKVGGGSWRHFGCGEGLCSSRPVEESRVASEEGGHDGFLGWKGCTGGGDGRTSCFADGTS